MKAERPLILITNDDGIGSRGIAHLTRIAVTLGNVVVVAPDSAQSVISYQRKHASLHQRTSAA